MSTVFLEVFLDDFVSDFAIGCDVSSSSCNKERSYLVQEGVSAIRCTLLLLLDVKVVRASEVTRGGHG